MSEYKPLKINNFRKIKRRPIKPSFPEIPRDFINNRRNVSDEWLQRINALTGRLATLTPEQKKAVF